MRPSGRPLSELQKAAQPSLLRTGMYDGEFGEVTEQLSQQGNPTFAAQVVIHLTDGTTLEIRDYLTDVGRAALKFFNACSSVGIRSKYESKDEITADDFIGRPVRVKVAVEKRRGFPDRNRIDDYSAPAAAIVKLRSAS